MLLTGPAAELKEGRLEALIDAPARNLSATGAATQLSPPDFRYR